MAACRFTTKRLTLGPNGSTTSKIGPIWKLNSICNQGPRHKLYLTFLLSPNNSQGQTTDDEVTSVQSLWHFWSGKNERISLSAQKRWWVGVRKADGLGGGVGCWARCSNCRFSLDSQNLIQGNWVRESGPRNTGEWSRGWGEDTVIGSGLKAAPQGPGAPHLPRGTKREEPTPP